MLKTVLLLSARYPTEHAVCALQVLEDEFVNDMTVRHGFDLHMLVVCGGKERTRSEWEALLGQAGFKLNKIYPSKGIQSMIETELS